MTKQQQNNVRRIQLAAGGFRFLSFSKRRWHEIGPLQYIAQREVIKHLARTGGATRCKVCKVRTIRVKATEQLGRKGAK